MSWTSVIAIYSLFWVMSAFLVMPFGVRTHEEAGIERVPGQADSAPANFRPGRIALRASLLSLVLFGLYYLNYVNGWIGPEDINLFGRPPGYEETSAALARPPAAS
jgi:predicted secreted protein